MEGELPPGWKMDSNTKDQALLLFPEFIELECPSVTFSRIARPVDTGAALEWHAVESRPIPGRENKVGSLRKMSIAGVDGE